MELTARDIMDAQVICIQADATVKEALEFLVAPPLPGVLVLDAAGHLVGTLAMLDVMEGAEPMGGAVRTEIGAGDSGLEFYEYDSRFCEAPGKMATVRLNEMMDKTRAILGPAVMNRPARELMSTTLISAGGAGGRDAVRPANRQADCRRGRQALWPGGDGGGYCRNRRR